MKCSPTEAPRMGASSLRLRLTLKRDSKRLVSLGQLIAVNSSQFVLQCSGSREAVRDCIGVSQSVDFDRFDRGDANVADARNVASLPRSHVAELPQANCLSLFARAYRGQEFLFEEEHGY